MPYRSNTNLQPVAAIVWQLLKAYRDAEDASERKWCKTTLTNAIRSLEIFIDPSISEKAAQMATVRGISDLRKLRWGNRNTKRDDQKKSIHWEHFIPVSLMLDRLLRSEGANVEDVEKILREAEVVWITSDENALLDEKGYRHKDRATTEESNLAYKNCDIRRLD